MKDQCYNTQQQEQQQTTHKHKHTDNPRTINGTCSERKQTLKHTLVQV